MEMKRDPADMERTACQTPCPWKVTMYEHACKYLRASATACPNYTRTARSQPLKMAEHATLATEASAAAPLPRNRSK